jgi:hypothetical protein
MLEPRFTTTCNRPDCQAWLVSEIGPYQVGPDPPGDEKPDAIRCAEGHTFPVLERMTAPGGQHAYKLGPEGKGARFAAWRW